VITPLARRYGTRSQGISQFYLHTPRSSANGMNHICLLPTYLPTYRLLTRGSVYLIFIISVLCFSSDRDGLSTVVSIIWPSILSTVDTVA